MNQSTDNPFRCVFLVAHSQYRYFLLALARRLHEQKNSKLHLYVATPQEEKFYRQNAEPGVFATIEIMARLYDAVGALNLDEAKVVAEARNNEKWLGCTYNHINISDRHLGRGYALAGFYHPRSNYSEGTNYVQMLHAYNEIFVYWKNQFDLKQPSLMLQGGKTHAVIARTMGIPFRQIAGARVQNYHFWAQNEYFEIDELNAAITNASGNFDVEAAMDRPYLSHRTIRDNFLAKNRKRDLPKRLFLILARHVYWRLRRYEKARGYLLRERLFYEVRMQRDIARYIGSHMPSLESLGNQPFVFFPLHTEPETALQTLSPEYFYQHAAIAAISRDLPAGFKLVVKDTPYSLGRRPSNFYDQIRDLKNVILLETLEPGLDIVRRAAAVVTITGTAGFEAAVLGKPVISFGRHNLYGVLPHIRIVNDETHLKDYLEEVLAPEFDSAEALRDGARFLEAMISVSFDLRDYDYIDLKDFDSESVDDATMALYRSLESGFATVENSE
jgi:hypothetical protein